MNRKIIMLLTIPLAIGCSTSQAAEKAAKPEAKPAAANIADRRAAAVVNSKCIECHGTGKQHSLRIGDREDWVKRASKGLMRWCSALPAVMTACPRAAAVPT